MNRINRRSLNLSFSRKKPTEYHYIQDFENTTEKECKKSDKNNDQIYERNIALYTQTKKFLEKKNAIFKMEGPPSPPRVPSNYELYIIHQNRNSLTNNKIQTMAILFLLQIGYKLVIDPCVELIPKVMNRDNKLFEPYMAIDLASSVNKNFIKEVSKYYELKGERLGSPELLSIEQKIDKFNQEGMIEYLDLNGETNTENQKISRHFSVPCQNSPKIISQSPNRSVSIGQPTFSSDLASVSLLAQEINTIHPISTIPVTGSTHSSALPTSLPPICQHPSAPPATATPATATPATALQPSAPPATTQPTRYLVDNTSPPNNSQSTTPPTTEKNEPISRNSETPPLGFLPDTNPPAYGVDNTNNTNEDGKINIFINK